MRTTRCLLARSLICGVHQKKTHKTPPTILVRGRQPQLATLSSGADKPDELVYLPILYLQGPHQSLSGKATDAPDLWPLGQHRPLDSTPRRQRGADRSSAVHLRRSSGESEGLRRESSLWVHHLKGEVLALEGDVEVVEDISSKQNIVPRYRHSLEHRNQVVHHLQCDEINRSR